MEASEGSMIIIELPTYFYKNYKEVADGEEKGIEVQGIEYVKKTTFFIPDTEFVTIFPFEEDDTKTSLTFFDTSYKIDLDYETVRMLFKDALK